MGIGKQISSRLPERLKDWLRRHLIPDETNLVYQAIKELGVSGVMLDVGACIGHALRRFANDGWTIYAFEPDQVNRDQLAENWGDMPSVHIDPRAVLNRTATDVPFFRSEASAGISGLSAFHESHEQSGTVETIALDVFCREAGITKVDFLKVDTEGFDLLVLEGMPWEVIAPRVVMCEFEDSKTVPLGYTFDDLASYLHDRNYHILVSEWYPIVNYGGPHRWRRFVRYPCKLADSKAWGNLIAVQDHDDLSKLTAASKRLAPTWQLGMLVQRLLQRSGIEI